MRVISVPVRTTPLATITRDEMRAMRALPPPWTVEPIPGGYKVLDANGQSLAYVYGRESKADADIANVPLEDLRLLATV